ncbi:MAG TPA: hypothetical protein VJL80_00810 [Aeromicrobium sp.]|jgi:hypothetical protein|nr:hypothetical protein [Aeromicrobium sp.]HKY56563.1 hypothetical protein [Aeromicrobium sp.]
MNDKSPRQQMSKKSAKSIKEKRADRRAKQPDAIPEANGPRKSKGR